MSVSEALCNHGWCAMLTMKHTLSWHVWVMLGTVEFTYYLKNNEME